MTALREFQRLEAAGLWRETPDAQRRDVIVSVGDATLTITDMNDKPLAHWSLAAIERANPGQFPALFHPDGDPGETLEIAEDEATMLDAIERVKAAIEHSRPHPGRLRAAGVFAVMGLLALLVVLWLPAALQKHAVNVVPDIKRKAIGEALLGRIERVAGQACTSADTGSVLEKLALRTGIRRLVIFRSGLASSLHLPGGIVLLNKTFVEDYEDPSVAAGAILAERARTQMLDPLAELLNSGGTPASFRLLTTGQLERKTLDHYVETVLSTPRPPLPDETLLAEFARASISSTPYAYAIDITGETTLGLIEADPMAGRRLEPVLSDADWVRLQNICS